MLKKCTLGLGIIFILILTTAGKSQAQDKNTEIYKARRQALMDKLDDGLVLLKSPKATIRNGDNEYKYRQDSDVYYLTGYEEPGIIVLLDREADKKFVLFVPKQHSYMILFQGMKPGPAEIMRQLAADTVFYLDAFEEQFGKYLRGKKRIYAKLKDDDFTDKIIGLINRPHGLGPAEIVDPLPLIHEMRVRKDTHEITLMQHAVDITAEAHREAMRAVKPGMNERDVEAVIEYIYRKNGSPRWGFRSIVGAGRNSCILHYQQNNQTMRDGDMLVMDIGAEYGYYSADVTRTIPVNGKFSVAQREIYNLVLKAHQAAIAAVKPGAGFRDPEEASTAVLKEGLLNLGLITDRDSRWQYRVWLPHPISHWLGLDVHDAGAYTNEDHTPRTLEPGMVLTIEPGLYFGESMLDYLPRFAGMFYPGDELDPFIEKVKPVFEKYRNIGIRIEDDVLVTDEGHRVLSENIPRSIAEIEKIMSKQTRWMK